MNKKPQPVKIHGHAAAVPKIPDSSVLNAALRNLKLNFALNAGKNSLKMQNSVLNAVKNYNYLYT